MTIGMYVSAAGAEAQSRKLEVISHNMANANTPGFRPMLAVLQARDSEAIERGLDYAGSKTLNDQGGGMNMTATVTNYSVGIPKPTGNPTDLFIADQGEGFFVVQKDGQQYLTRAGNFHFNADGELQNTAGYSVLGDDNNPIQVNPAGPRPKLLTDGSFDLGGERLPLKLVKPVSLGDLARAGENLFKPLGETVPIEAGKRRVFSGKLELSSVKPTQEMVQLIQTSRSYEANVRMIQHHDQLAGTLINRVLRQQ